jgi:hypothetical protein
MTRAEVPEALPGKRGYAVVEAELAERLAHAVVAAAVTETELEESEAEVVAVYKAIDDYETERTEDDARERWENENPQEGGR